MKILIDEEVVKQALDALDTFGDHTSDEQCPVCEAITLLRSALDAAEADECQPEDCDCVGFHTGACRKAEPVAWMIVTNNKNVPDRHDTWLTFDIAEFKYNSAPCLTIAEVTPLYSTQSDRYEIPAFLRKGSD